MTPEKEKSYSQKLSSDSLKMPEKEKVKKISISNFDDKARKTWWKVIIDHYFKKLKKCDQYQKLIEKYNNNDNFVKSLIIDMKIKQVINIYNFKKELAIHLKKQWMILKKFNLQEKIYREESKLLIESESQKDNLITSEIIQKLAEYRMTGFEDPEVLKTRTMDKMTKTYQIDEEVIKELNCVFFDPKYTEQESNLLVSRREAQLDAVIKISKSVPEPEYDLDNYYNNMQYKIELKRFERELETKAVQKITNYSEEFALSNPNKDLLEPKYDDLYQNNSSNFVHNLSGSFGESNFNSQNFHPNHNFSSYNNYITLSKNTSFNNIVSPIDENPFNNIKKFTNDLNDTDAVELEKVASGKNLSFSPNNNIFRSMSNIMHYDDINGYDEKQEKFNKNDFFLSKLVEINENKVNNFKKSLYDNLMNLMTSAPEINTLPSDSNMINNNSNTDSYQSKILNELNVFIYLIKIFIG